MLNPQDCDDPNMPQQSYICYWDRMTKMLDDAKKYGVVVDLQLFDKAQAETEWNINPFNPDNQLPKQRNEISYTPSTINFSQGMYKAGFTYWDEESHSWVWYENLYKQQKKLIEMIMFGSYRYPTVFYEPMNEPNMSFYQAFHDQENNYFNPAIKWHEFIYYWMTVYYYADPAGPNGRLLRGLNLYRFQANPIGDWDITQNCLYNFFNGSTNPYYPGISPDNVDIITYHTPYYKLNTSCSERIDDLKSWHRINFPGKACIIDTDGDGGPCRDNFDTLESWAYAAFYHDSSEDYADFITKGKNYYNPDEPDPQWPSSKINELKYRVRKAYNDANPRVPVP